MSKISLRYVCSNLVNFQSGSKVYIVEPSLVLRNTNKDLNFTFTVGWGWGCSIPGLRSTELDETWLNGLSQLSDEERILTAI